MFTLRFTWCQVTLVPIEWHRITGPSRLTQDEEKVTIMSIILRIFCEREELGSFCTRFKIPVNGSWGTQRSVVVSKQSQYNLRFWLDNLDFVNSVGRGELRHPPRSLRCHRCSLCHTSDYVLYGEGLSIYIYWSFQVTFFFCVGNLSEFCSKFRFGVVEDALRLFDGFEG